MNYLPQLNLPPYAFVPGYRPHPVRDARGHSYGKTAPTSEALDPSRPWRCRAYLLGIDLFNRGYYWEAHEAWEALWAPVERRSPIANLLQGLIRLAGAGVKARLGNQTGVVRLATRAHQQLQGVRQAKGSAFAGSRLDEWIQFADCVASDPPRGEPEPEVQRVFDRDLRLQPFDHFDAGSVIAAVDVHYSATSAAAACVVFDRWSDTSPILETTRIVPHGSDYVPGQFWRRELSPVLAVLEKVPRPGLLVVDGYVFLDRDDRPGLGKRVYDALGGTTPVLGIAKRAFRGSDHAVFAQRGTSRQPLFVTAVGLDASQGAEAVAMMAGAHRIPTLLKRVDQLARATLAALSDERQGTTSPPRSI